MFELSNILTYVARSTMHTEAMKDDDNCFSLFYQITLGYYAGGHTNLKEVDSIAQLYDS